jgi:BASS family bile acid:Na+ symporter
LVKGILDLGVLFVIILMMAAVGLELEGHHFRAVLQRKRLLLLSLASQTVLLPALAFGLAHALALPPRISAGMLLIAACPVGDIANFYTLLARANLALSVTLNALTILIAPATMALVFETYDHVIGVPFEFALPTPTIFLRLTLLLVMPLLAGMAVRRVRPESAALYGRSLRRIVAVGIVYLITTTIATQYDQLAEEWQQTAAAGAMFVGVALAVGLVLARLLRLSKDDSVTIGIGFAVRNVALALAIAVTLLNRIDYAVFAAVYFITEVPLLLGAVGIYRKLRAPAAQPV